MPTDWFSDPFGVPSPKRWRFGSVFSIHTAVLTLPHALASWRRAHRRGLSLTLVGAIFAVMLVPPDNRLSQSGTLLTAQSLDDAGVPVLRLCADMVDAKTWDHATMVAMVETFLQEAGLI